MFDIKNALCLKGPDHGYFLYEKDLNIITFDIKMIFSLSCLFEISCHYFFLYRKNLVVKFDIQRTLTLLFDIKKGSYHYV